ncbi:MAG: hypothetical protein Q7J20_05655 [Candidatus Nitrotoga sp.]|nr:hypothetical protein [Candidatus Nitrotoga sp.]MDO9447372.1 hypothetical protein [Candidatus Nitrotoga sp.]
MSYNILKQVLTLGILVFLSLSHVHAAPIYGYSLGVSLENVVVPDSIVSINAGLANTGNTPIFFPSTISGGPPSVQGGSVPFAGANASGDWSILANDFTSGPTFGIEDFFDQFEGVVVNPGEVFGFVFGSFRAPSDQPLGSSATPSFNFGINFTDNVIGNLLGISGTGFNYGAFDNAPTVVYALGVAAVTSELSFYEGLVVNTTTGEVVSGPKTSTILEPSILLLLTGGLMGFHLTRRQGTHRKRRTPEPGWS